VAAELALRAQTVLADCPRIVHHYTVVLKGEGVVKLAI
jgi:hypothetical protein